MKKLLTLLLLFVTIGASAQLGISYKALIKDGGGNVLANQSVTTQFTILEDIAQTNVYQETHTATTDSNGIVVLIIGDGTTSDTFTDIDWSIQNHSLNVQIDSGSGLIDLGTTPFQSVPYAKFAESTIVEINDLTDAKTESRSIYIGTGSGDSDNGNDNQNTALGDDAMKGTTSGVQNVAIGESTLRSNTTGDRNTVLGQSAMRLNSSGSRNTAIGEEALYNNISGSGNVAIGNLAGRNETGSDKLYIENSNADSDNALIYGEFDNNILRVNGEVQVGNPTGTGYSLPTTDGTASQVLTTDGSGQLSFTTPTAGGSDADWFEEGTTTVPSAITDDIYTQGNVAIGKNTADSPLDIEVTGAPANLIAIKVVDNSTGTGDHTGMQQSLGGTHNETIRGIDTYINNAGTGLHTGINIAVANGTGNQIGNRATVSGSTGTNTLFSGAIFNNGTASAAIQTGIRLESQQPSSQISYGVFNSLNASGADATGTKYGFYNLIDGGTGDHIGIYNDIRGAESNTKYGTYNRFGIGTTDTGGELYGTYNSFGPAITSTSTKYGSYTLIPSALAGTHYGSYSDVQNTTGYAGYFIGRMSLGNTTSDRYTMPAADGAAGEVLTAAGDGSTSWAAPGASSKSIVSATMSSGQGAGSSYVKIQFNATAFDTNGEFDTANNRFVASNSGYYRVNASAFLSTSFANPSVGMSIYVNGVAVKGKFIYNLPGPVFSNVDGIIFLNATDYVEIFMIATGGGGTINSTNQYSFFEIQQID